MKILKKLFSIALSITLCSIFIIASACNQKYDSISSINFNTEVYIVVDGKISTQTKNDIFTLLDGLEEEFSLAEENSFVSKLNNLSVNQPLAITERTKDILSKCKSFNNLTNKFNPAVLPLLDLWQLSSSTYKGKDGELIIPSESEIETKKENLDLNSLIINETTVCKNKDIKIDVGGVLKGYSADLIKEILIKNGHKKGYVNIGGSSLSFLTLDDGLQIRNPRNSSNNILFISKQDIINKSISTSGDYERYYVKDGVRYSHIIDPNTASPSQTKIASATIVCEDGCFADAITTALCCMTKEELIEFTKTNLQGFSVYAVYIDGETKEILTNKKQGENFTLLDSSYNIVNIV